MPQYTAAQLLEIFPEARAIIPKKIIEWRQLRAVAIKNLRNKIIQVKTIVAPENQWLHRVFLKHLDAEEVAKIGRHISRLERLRAIGSYEPYFSGHLNASMLVSARTVPTVEILQKHVTLRKTGRQYIGLCFLHKERKPSLVVYPDTHSWYCFGCNEGGDNIALVRKLFSFSFQEAVTYLINL